MNAQPTHFAPLARLLHWLMALMILSMLFIGAGIVASVSQRHEWLVNIHKPLGVAILLLVVVRLVVRFSTHTPPLPADLPGWQALAAKLSHYLLYALMLVTPLIGWAMISAAGDPVMLGSSLQLPSIVSANASTFTFCARPTCIWLTCFSSPFYYTWRPRYSMAGSVAMRCWAACCVVRTDSNKPRRCISAVRVKRFANKFRSRRYCNIRGSNRFSPVSRAG